MKRLARLPGWLLAAVWLAVPAVAVALVVVSLDGGDDSPLAGDVLGPAAADVDVQTPALRQQRQAAGIDDCPLPGAGPADPGLPSLSLPCLGGAGEVNLGDLHGPLVLNVWAQSCGPCREEMPLLQRLHASTDEVAVLGVDFQDTQPGMALALAEVSGVTYPSVADVDGALKQPPMSVGSLPWTYFVDAGGQIVAVERGAFGSYAELTVAVDEHLGIEA